jgi:hypothetical protein
MAMPSFRGIAIAMNYDAQLRIVVHPEPVIGPRFARTRWDAPE